MTERLSTQAASSKPELSFSLASCQLTLFTPEEEISSVKIIRDLLPKWDELFGNAEPIILPSVPGMPREIPRLIIKSTDEVWRCEIASERINLVWEARIEPKTATVASVQNKGIKVLIDYKEFLNARVTRMAAVITRIRPMSKPAMFLAEHFCKPQWLKAPLNRPESFELHAHKKYQLDSGLKVNSWVRNKTGSLLADQSPVVVVEQDLNTLVEESSTNNFDSGAIRHFFSSVPAEFDTILNLYYPTGAA